MITIKTWRDPYDSGFSPTSPRQVSFEPGLTVLVGCNGAGKTTLLHNINEEMKHQDIPHYLYDNLRSGGSSSIGEALFHGDSSLGVSLWCASEGEAIKINFNQLSSKFIRFLDDGFFDTKRNRLAEIFRDKEGGKEGPITNQRVLLFDAVDSGLSVDSIVEVKAVFDAVLAEAKKRDVELYLIISANEYELARGSKCFDVNSGKYVEIKDYEAYRSFILKNRVKKEKRIKKQEEWFEKQRQKEAEAKEKRRLKYEPLINAINETAKSEDRELTWSEKYKIDEYKRAIEGR